MKRNLKYFINVLLWTIVFFVMLWHIPTSQEDPKCESLEAREAFKTEYPDLIARGNQP